MRRPVLVLSLILTSATQLAAQEPSRVLNGHEFMPSRIVDGPFAISEFGSLTGGGIAFDLKTPYVGLAGDTLGMLVGDVAFLALAFSYQQKFGDWFAARFAFGGGARLGIDEQTVLAQGVTGSFSWTLGATARIFQAEKIILSGAVDFRRADLVGLDPFSFAQKIIDEGLGAEDNDLVGTAEAVSAIGSLRAGWAPAPWIGFTGLLEAGYGDVTESSSKFVIGGGATVGTDLKNLGTIPIGIQLSAKSDAFQTGGADLASRSWAFGFGVFYTGWDDFSVGLETELSLLDRRGVEDDFEAFTTSFGLRYWP